MKVTYRLRKLLARLGTVSTEEWLSQLRMWETSGGLKARNELIVPPLRFIIVPVGLLPQSTAV
jgi:hypothetical protein